MDRPFPTATVRRGGQYTDNWVDVEDPDCTLSVRHDFLNDSDTLTIRLAIPAAGGGTTGVLLQLGPADVSLLLGTVAQEWPGASVALIQAAAQAACATQEAITEANALLLDADLRLELVESTISVRANEEPGDPELADAVRDITDVQSALTPARTLLQTVSLGSEIAVGLRRINGVSPDV